MWRNAVTRVRTVNSRSFLATTKRSMSLSGSALPNARLLQTAIILTCGMHWRNLPYLATFAQSFSSIAEFMVLVYFDASINPINGKEN